jgi:hypothetical protein
LHAEPELAGSLLVLEDEGCGDATWYDIPGDGDDTLGRLGKLSEGVWVEVEVVGSASRNEVSMVLYLACS